MPTNTICRSKFHFRANKANFGGLISGQKTSVLAKKDHLRAKKPISVEKRSIITEIFLPFLPYKKHQTITMRVSLSVALLDIFATCFSLPPSSSANQIVRSLFLTEDNLCRTILSLCCVDSNQLDESASSSVVFDTVLKKKRRLHFRIRFRQFCFFVSVSPEMFFAFSFSYPFSPIFFLRFRKNFGENENVSVFSKPLFSPNYYLGRSLWHFQPLNQS